MRATYYISFNGVDYLQFYPSNEPKVSLTPEAGEIFLRWKVDSFKITKTKNSSIYDTLLSYFFDPTKFLTDIRYRIKEHGVTTFEFISPILKGQINTETKVYECTPEPDDPYRPVLHQYNTKWQNRIEGYLFGKGNYITYPDLVSSLFINADFNTFVDVSGDVEWENTSPEDDQFAYNTMAIASIDDSMTTILITDYTGDDFNLCLVNQVFATISSEVNVNANGKYELTQTANATTVYVRIRAINGTGTFTYKIYTPHVVQSGDSLYTIIDTVLNDVSYMNLSIGTISSTILWNDLLPSNAPENITYSATDDYVIEDTAIFNDIYLARVDAFTTGKEDVIEVSLQDVMGMLKKLRLWWFFDDDGAFRIEHEKYFRSYDPQVDLDVEDEDKPAIDSYLYTYENSDIYTQINYSENNQGSPDFMPYPVLFSPLKTSEKVKEVMFSDLTTDIQNVVTGSSVSTSGLILLRTVRQGTVCNVTFDESTINVGEFYMNAKLSWAWLFVNYYGYFADADSGTINNGIAKNYDGVKEFLHQKNIRFNLNSILDWKKPVTLSDGNGWLTEVRYTPDTGWNDIDLAFNPYDAVITGDLGEDLE